MSSRARNQLKEKGKLSFGKMEENEKPDFIFISGGGGGIKEY